MTETRKAFLALDWPGVMTNYPSIAYVTSTVLVNTCWEERQQQQQCQAECVLNLFILQLYTQAHWLTAENILPEVSYINSTNGYRTAARMGLIHKVSGRYVCRTARVMWHFYFQSQSMTVDLVQPALAKTFEHIQYSVCATCILCSQSEHISLHTPLLCVILLNILFRWNDLKTLVPEAKTYRTPVLVPE